MNAGKEPPQGKGCFPSFIDHNFISCQQVLVARFPQLPGEEQPLHLCPGQTAMIKALDRPITAAFFCLT